MYDFEEVVHWGGNGMVRKSQGEGREDLQRTGEEVKSRGPLGKAISTLQVGDVPTIASDVLKSGSMPL